VLLADTQGKARYDFQGKLSFSWPKYDHQFVLNKGDANYDPLFAYGYGLTYVDKKELGQFTEQASRAVTAGSDDGIKPLFVRNLAADMAWVLSDSSVAGSENSAAQNATLITTPYGVSADGTSLAMQSVNLSYQEDGRQLRWNSAEKASASLRYIEPVAGSDYSKAKALRLSLRLDQQVPAELSLGVLCDQQGLCQRELSLVNALAPLKAGVWHTVEVALDCVNQSTIKQVSDALVFSSSGQHSLAVAEMVLTAQKSTAAANGTVLIGCAN
jgi:beta-glucosidase